jgi:hypothetical protein
VIFCSSQRCIAIDPDAPVNVPRENTEGVNWGRFGQTEIKNNAGEHRPLDLSTTPTKETSK